MLEFCGISEIIFFERDPKILKIPTVQIFERGKFLQIQNNTDQLRFFIQDFLKKSHGIEITFYGIEYLTKKLLLVSMMSDFFAKNF